MYGAYYAKYYRYENLRARLCGSDQWDAAINPGQPKDYGGDGFIRKR